MINEHSTLLLDKNQEPIQCGSKQVLRKDRRDILMDFGLNRRKVIHLDGSNSLSTEFKSRISTDPALSDLLVCTYPVFHEFNAKFKVWVDIDCEKNLKDGAVVKVMFFPKVLESDYSNPGSIKRKIDGCDSEPNLKRKENIENNSHSLNLCVERNKEDCVVTTKGSNVSTSGTEGSQAPNTHFYRTTRRELLGKGNSENQPVNLTEELSPVTLARIQPLHTKEKQPANCPQKPALEHTSFKQTISWNTSLNESMMSERLVWAQKNRKKMWENTVFSDVALFGLEGNCIKYYEEFDSSIKECEIFWGFRSIIGPNIITPLGSSKPLNTLTLAEVLENKVINRLRNSHKRSLQFLECMLLHLNTKHMRDVLKANSIFLSEWPASAKDLSPIHHAWKLVGEKVKNIPCASKKKMISIVSEIWEEDFDVQLMCSEIIPLLPQIIKSAIKQMGSYPLVKVSYDIST